MASPTLNGLVASLAWIGTELVVTGNFTAVGQQPAPCLVRAVTTCPAQSNVLATQCVGPAGPLALAADALPWIGSTFTSTARGYANLAAGVALIGQTNPGIPLAQLHPLGAPRCDLLSSLELLLPVSIAGSDGRCSLPIPRSVALAGVQLFHQHLQLALSAQGRLLGVSSSNALRLTLGWF